MTSNSEEDLLVNHFNQHLDAVVHSFEALHSQIVTTIAGIIINALAFDKKLIAFGNGGSATQASHLAGELVGRFSKAPRRPLPAIALGADSGVVTCIGNNFGYESLFERQIAALVQSGDIAIGFTTSGKSNNCIARFGHGGKEGRHFHRTDRGCRPRRWPWQNTSCKFRALQPRAFKRSI